MGEGEFGVHLIVDAKGVPPYDNVDVETFIDGLILMLDMKPLGGMHTYRVDEVDNKGYSSFQMIMTSHIAFHGDELTNSFYLDVFSCKDFDGDGVLDFVQDYFGPDRMRHRIVSRNNLHGPAVGTHGFTIVEELNE